MTTAFFLTAAAFPHRFHAGASKIIGVSPLSMFIATAPPLELPTITSGRNSSYAA